MGSRFLHSGTGYPLRIGIVHGFAALHNRKLYPVGVRGIRRFRCEIFARSRKRGGFVIASKREKELNEPHSAPPIDQNEDVRFLGRLLGDVIRASEGEEVYRRIEYIRSTSVDRYRG